MAARIIDGKAIAARIKERLTQEMMGLPEGSTPCLATLLVGDDYGAAQYRGQIERLATGMGYRYLDARLPASADLSAIQKQVRELADDASVHGILPLRPFPDGISDDAVVQCLPPSKDIDGFHPDNLGRLLLDVPRLVPSTARACMVA
ncbi:MAG: tetrahydrofolate dehydrogenase/cyclohydrolase catalytic domain-containing protein, partial [Nitrospirota bacterium]